MTKTAVPAAPVSAGPRADEAVGAETAPDRSRRAGLPVGALPLGELRAVTPAQVLDLQRTIGNLSTQRLLEPALQRDALTQKKEKHYEQVALLIIELAQSRGISIEQALFLVAQAQGEQGFDDPLKNKNRVFNAQATWPEEKDLKLHPQEGIKTERVESPEFIDGEWKLLISPFYVYDTLERSFDHFFERLELKHRKALDVLKSSTGTIEQYAKALRATGYGTDPDYVSKLLKQYGSVVKELNQFVGERIDLEAKNIDRAGGALAQEWGIVKRLWNELNELKGQKQQSTDDAHMDEIDAKIAETESELKEHEGVLKGIEEFLKERNGQLEKLTKLQDGLNVKAAQAGAY